MISKGKSISPLIVLLLLAGITHFLFFGHPNQTVFDEVHFGKFISGYYTGEYFFDIHPPLGKLLIAGFAKLFDFKPEFAFGTIGDPFPNRSYLVLRFLPALAGTLLSLVLYGLARELGFSRAGSLAVGVLAAFENALVTQSRYILLDPFLLVFGFGALWCYLRYRASHSLISVLGVGILGGMAASVKWTGLTFLALPFLIELFQAVQERRFSRLLKHGALAGAAALVLYFGIFAVHFGLLPTSGTGDAFMSVGFQKTLAGSRYAGDNAPTPNLFEKFLELNTEMFRSNQRLTAEHPYSSPWYTWPFMARSIFYWVDGAERVYLLGNPLIWWLSTIAILTLFFLTASRNISPGLTGWMLLGGYALNLLPFVGIGRVMFLYHYLSALIFAILALVYLIEKQKNAVRNLSLLAAAAAFLFVYFAPLTYGLKLTPDQYEQRVWLPSWK